VDGLAVMAELLLGKALRVSRNLGTLGPGVAVGVQGDPLDAESVATLLELGGPVSGPYGGEVGEEESLLG